MKFVAEPGNYDVECDYERFRWTILSDAVFENAQGLWEPPWSLRGDILRHVEICSEQLRPSSSLKSLSGYWAT
jgi:hypothetical protein